MGQYRIREEGSAWNREAAALVLVVHRSSIKKKVFHLFSLSLRKEKKIVSTLFSDWAQPPGGWAREGVFRAERVCNLICVGRDLMLLLFFLFSLLPLHMC